MITAPTTTMVSVWPIPHTLPIRAALRIERCRLTIVPMAMTWSGSVAWRIPRKKPRETIDISVITGLHALSEPPRLSAT